MGLTDFVFGPPQEPPQERAIAPNSSEERVKALEAQVTELTRRLRILEALLIGDGK